MITDFNSSGNLQLLPFLPEGGSCKHPRHWCVKFNGEFYSFKADEQLHKDQWVSETRNQIGLLETLKILYRFCPKCRTVQTP